MEAGNVCIFSRSPARQGSVSASGPRMKSRLPLLSRTGPSGGREGQDLRFVWWKLTQNTEVGRDHTLPLLSVIRGLCQVELPGLHEVSHVGVGQTGDPIFTVDQDLAYCFLKVGANVSMRIHL